MSQVQSYGLVCPLQTNWGSSGPAPCSEAVPEPLNSRLGFIADEKLAGFPTQSS